VTGPTVVKMAQRIETNGLVERRRDDPDGRLVRVYLTDGGRELGGTIAAEIDKIAGVAAAGIGARDRDVLRWSLEVVRENVRAAEI
jgi:DNA-binding MarR family transcriptional regulator